MKKKSENVLTGIEVLLMNYEDAQISLFDNIPEVMP